MERLLPSSHNTVSMALIYSRLHHEGVFPYCLFLHSENHSVFGCPIRCKLHGGDVPSAYVCADVDPDAKPVYISQPPGFVEKGNDFVWLMLKEIYGYPPVVETGTIIWLSPCWLLLHSEQCWSLSVHDCWIKWNYVFGCYHGWLDLVFHLHKIAQALHGIHVWKIWSKILQHSWLVDWMQIKQDELFQVSLNQSDYKKLICQEYNHLVRIHYKTPADPKIRLCLNSYPTNIPIPTINGKFLYASNTWPDISYAIGQICKFQPVPPKNLRTLFVHLISYLNGCPNEEINLSSCWFLTPIDDCQFECVLWCCLCWSIWPSLHLWLFVFLCSNLISCVPRQPLLWNTHQLMLNIMH